ncbi:MAG: DUF4405 domain-containing protein [Eubacteriales bacterium]
MAFHEVGGLALIGLFVIHHLVNGRWIAATRKLFSKTTPGMVRARYIVDVLLLIAFLAVGVTGVLINKTLFTVHAAGNAKTLHYFSAALAVLLMGVHLGLHADYIFGKVFRRGANRVAKIAVGAVLAAMIAFGGYSLATTQFVSFLTAPVRTAGLRADRFNPMEMLCSTVLSARCRAIFQMPQLSGDNAVLRLRRRQRICGQGNSSGIGQHNGAENRERRRWRRRFERCSSADCTVCEYHYSVRRGDIRRCKAFGKKKNERWI